MNETTTTPHRTNSTTFASSSFSDSTTTTTTTTTTTRISKSTAWRMMMKKTNRPPDDDDDDRHPGTRSAAPDKARLLWQGEKSTDSSPRPHVLLAETTTVAAAAAAAAGTIGLVTARASASRSPTGAATTTLSNSTTFMRRRSPAQALVWLLPALVTLSLVMTGIMMPWTQTMTYANWWPASDPPLVVFLPTTARQERPSLNSGATQGIIIRDTDPAGHPDSIIIKTTSAVTEMDASTTAASPTSPRRPDAASLPSASRAETTTTAAGLSPITLAAHSTTPSPPWKRGPYAYAFVIGGCHPAQPHYRHYIYNILVATRILRSLGSTAEVVVLFQLSMQAPESTLPEQDHRLLRAMHISVYYIPKQANENFYRTQLDKFRILALTQYRRVLFMDGDVMPAANLDYLFELSEQGILRENLVTQGKFEPANGGFFMLTPSAESLQDLQNIIAQRETAAHQLGYPYFDPIQGWGHAITPPDHWAASQGGRATNWTFLAAFADQGLLYHWVKYARRSVSICLRNGRVENWIPHPNGDGPMVILQETTPDNPFLNHSHRIHCWGMDCSSGPPLADFHHFTGRTKPWLRGPPPEMILTSPVTLSLSDLSVNNSQEADFSINMNSTRTWSWSNETALLSAKHYWFAQLLALNDELDMQLDFVNWTLGERPSLGMYPTYGQVLVAQTNLSDPAICHLFCSEEDNPTLLERAQGMEGLSNLTLTQ